MSAVRLKFVPTVVVGYSTVGARPKSTLVFKRGNKVQTEIVEFETAEIIGENRYSIRLGILLPKIYKDRDGDYIEWEKEISLKPKQIINYEDYTEIK